MKASISLGPYSGITGWKFVSNQSIPGSETLPFPGTAFKDIMLSHDPLIASLLGPRESTAFVDIGMTSLDVAPNAFSQVSPLLDTPVNTSVYDRVRDERRNASILHHVFEFLHSPFDPNHDTLSREHPCFQANYRGGLVSKALAEGYDSVLSSYLPFGLGHAGASNVRMYTSHYNVYGCYNGGPFLADWETNAFHHSHKDFVRRMAEQSPYSHTDPLRYKTNLNITFRDFGLLGYEFDCVCTCQFFGTFGSTACTYKWAYTFRMEGVQPMHWVDFGSHYRLGKGAKYYPDLRDVFRLSFEYITCDTASMDVSPLDMDSYLYAVHPIVKGQSILSDPPSLGVDDFKLAFRRNTYAFSDECFADLVNLKDANYLSTVDSVNDMQRGTSSDILQTLSKLPDAASMIPKIREFISICEDIQHRKIDISTIKDLVGLAATTNLQSNFQWQPFQRFLTEQLPEVIRGISDGWSRNSIVIGRGKFSFAFDTGYLHYPSARLTARSKIVVDTGVSSVFGTVLGLDGLGVMPKPSNLWDLIPFSFVVNWITGVGANMRRAENGLFLLAFPTYGVHTIAIEAEPQAQDMVNWKLTIDPANAFRYRWYYRDVSRYIPLPTSGKYPFGLPTGSPPITLVLSLLYSLVLG